MRGGEGVGPGAAPPGPAMRCSHLVRPALSPCLDLLLLSCLASVSVARTVPCPTGVRARLRRCSSGAAPRALLLGRCSSGAALQAPLLGRCLGASPWALLRRHFSCALWRRSSGVLGRRSLGAPRAPLTSAPRGSLLAVLGRCSRVAMRMLRSSAALGHCSAAAPRVLLEHRCPGHCRHAAIVCVRTVRSRPSSTTRPSSQCHFNPTAHKAIISARATGPAPRARDEASQMRPSRCVPRRICLSHRFWWFVGPCCVRAGAWGELPG